MTIPLVVGARSSGLPELREQLPLNLQIQVVDVGLEKAYLAPIEGVEDFLTLSGTFRGYVVWRDILFIVVDGTVYRYAAGTLVSIGAIADDGKRVEFANAFERLAILSAEALYYVVQGADYSVLAPVDPSLSFGIKSVTWLDGYFVLSDGQTLYNTDILDPDVVIPVQNLQIQSDSSAILGLLTIRAELYVVLRNSIQLLTNYQQDALTASTAFPFTPIPSGMISKGAVNARAFVFFMDVIAFVGGAVNEAPSVYIYARGTLQRIATREVELVLSSLTQTELNEIFLEAVVFGGKANLFIHMNGECYVYDHQGTMSAQTPLWHRRQDSLNESELVDYSCTNFLRYSDKMLCVQDDVIKSLALIPYVVNGNRPYWMFSTPIIYDKSKGVIIHREELVVSTGRDEMNDGTVGVSSSQDGINFSDPVTVKTGNIGHTLHNVVWFRRGFVRNWRIEKFVGLNAPFVAILSLECDVEELQA